MHPVGRPLLTMGTSRSFCFSFVPDPGADPSDVGQRELGEKVRTKVLGARLKYLQQLWAGRVRSGQVTDQVRSGPRLSAIDSKDLQQLWAGRVRSGHRSGHWSGQVRPAVRAGAQVLCARLKYLQKLWVGRVRSDLINLDHLDQFYDNVILRTLG